MSNTTQKVIGLLGHRMDPLSFNFDSENDNELLVEEIFGDVIQNKGI